MWSSLLALTLLSCAPAPPPERAYLAALGSLSRCAEVAPGDLRGECVAMAARERARAGEPEVATGACDQAGLGIWQGECWFLVSDALEATGPEAEALCERAGPHRGQCLGHAAAREAKQLLATPGAELEALRTLEARVARYRQGPRVQEEAWQLLVKQRASQDPGQPFSRALCGALEPSRCAEILRARLGPSGLCAADPAQVAPDAAALLQLAQEGCPEAQ